MEFLAGNRIRALSSERTAVTSGGYGGAFDLSTLSFVRTETVAVEGDQPQGLYWKPNGTVFYVVGSIRDEVTEYDCSTPWDISTATAGGVLSLSTEGIQPTGIFFKSDGTKFFTSDINSDSIESYTMSVAWDVTTGTVNAGEAFDISGATTNPYDIFMSTDGLKMYVIDNTSDNILQYTLGTAYNPSTAGSLVTQSTSSWQGSPMGIFIDDSGTKMYLSGNDALELDQFKLTTPWDISTLEHQHTISANGTGTRSIYVKPDGLKFYDINLSADVVTEYNLGTGNGAVLYETDTNKSYVLYNGSWTEL